MKFKLFLEAALEQGADYIATGHYARVQHPDSRSNSLPASSAGPAHSVNDAAPETASARRELDTPVSLHTSSAGPAARSAPENFSVELKTFSGAAPPRVTHEEAQLSGGVVFETSAQTRESSPELSGRLEDCLSEASSAETPDSDGLVSRRAEAVSNSAPPDKTLLLRAKDEDKDQTYFLYRVGSEALSKVLFPLGDYTKQEVRQMAKDRGLWTADKKESMGICFVGQVGIREFLSQYVKTQPGDIIDSDTNQVVGQHDGAIFYTLGQRHGLDLGGGLPYYVVGKDMNKNEVYVSRKLNDQNLWKDKLTLEDVFWVNSAPRNGKYLFRTRHRAKLIEGELTIGQTTMVSLDSPERAVTPGQSVVIYDGEVVLGGGIVKTD
ncbi:hypothetical protein CR969_03205 [Candidatus Saccharibacteria bacterium]|nr:MAG: hypothetical protein CR969_03205 [Candidatus Saccharibacteria bacterium]